MAALREFAEEIGTPAPQADYLELGAFRQPSGQIITTFAARIRLTVRAHHQQHASAGIDDARRFRESEARSKLAKGQDALAEYLGKLGRP